MVVVGESSSHSSGVNGLVQTVTPLLVSHSSSAAVVEVIAGTVVVGAVVVGAVVVGAVVVGTVVVGAVVVGTVVVGAVVVGTVVVGAVVVGTVVVGTVVVGTVVVGAVVVGAVVVGTVVVGAVVVGESSSHSSGVNGLVQTVTPLLVSHCSSAAAAAANMTSPAAIRKRNADPCFRAADPFGSVHCQDSCGRIETVPTVRSELYRARTDPATFICSVQRFRDRYLVEAAELEDESRSSRLRRRPVPGWLVSGRWLGC